MVVGCWLWVVGCGLFSCLVDCIVYTFNKTTKQQNHQTTKQPNNKTTKQQNNNIKTLLSYSLSKKN